MGTVAASSLEKQSPGARPCVPAASEVTARPHEAQVLLRDGGRGAARRGQWPWLLPAPGTVPPDPAATP